MKREALILSNSRRFWELFDRAAAGQRTPLEALPDPEDDAAWKRLAARKRRAQAKKRSR